MRLNRNILFHLYVFFLQFVEVIQQRFILCSFCFYYSSEFALTARALADSSCAILLISFSFPKPFTQTKRKPCKNKQKTTKFVVHIATILLKMLWVFGARASMACQLFCLMFNKIANFIQSNIHRLSVNMSTHTQQ